MREPELNGRHVSRETLEKLQRYEARVRKWTSRINLVSAADLDVLWSRHILDSAQLVDLTECSDRWFDLGSGAGFPGLVVAILLEDHPMRMTLVESDKRKCAFLRAVSREMNLNVDVVAKRIEQIKSGTATTVSARALAPLEYLIAYAHQLLLPGGTALFPKGRNWQQELPAAKEKWSFDCDVIQSRTDCDAAILRLRNITRI